MLGHLVNSLLAPLGLELRRKRPEPVAAVSQAASAHQLHAAILGRSDVVIFDVGAYTGQTIASYREVLPKAKIHAFEPYPPSFSVLQAEYGRTANVHLHKLALSDSNGRAAMHANVGPYTNSLSPASPRAPDVWPTTAVRPTGNTSLVETLTLDDFCRENHVWPDLLKLDVQTHELAVLRGGARTLEQVTIVYTEIIIADTYVGQPTPGALIAFLESAGLSLVSLTDLVERDGRILQLDATFVRKGAETVFRGPKATTVPGA